MNNDFPDKWYIEITPDNIDLVNEWKKTTQYPTCLHKTGYKYVDCEGGGWRGWLGFWVEITTEQFKQHVYNTNKESTPENYDYLIEILNKIK